MTDAHFADYGRPGGDRTAVFLVDELTGTVAALRCIDSIEMQLGEPVRVVLAGDIICETPADEVRRIVREFVRREVLDKIREEIYPPPARHWVARNDWRNKRKGKR